MCPQDWRIAQECGGPPCALDPSRACGLPGAGRLQVTYPAAPLPSQAWKGPGGPAGRNFLPCGCRSRGQISGPLLPLSHPAPQGVGSRGPLEAQGPNTSRLRVSLLLVGRRERTFAARPWLRAGLWSCFGQSLSSGCPPPRCQVTRHGLPSSRGLPSLPPSLHLGHVPILPAAIFCVCLGDSPDACPAEELCPGGSTRLCPLPAGLFESPFLPFCFPYMLIIF